MSIKQMSDNLLNHKLIIFDVVYESAYCNSTTIDHHCNFSSTFEKIASIVRIQGRFLDHDWTWTFVSLDRLFGMNKFCTVIAYILTIWVNLRKQSWWSQILLRMSFADIPKTSFDYIIKKNHWLIKQWWMVRLCSDNLNRRQFNMWIWPVAFRSFQAENEHQLLLPRWWMEEWKVMRTPPLAWTLWTPIERNPIDLISRQKTV